MEELSNSEYTFRRYRDVYYLRNNIQDSLTILTYVLTRVNCETNITEIVQQGTVDPAQEATINIIGDEDYILQVTGLSTSTINISHYLSLTLNVVRDVERALCNDFVYEYLNDCTPQEAKNCISYQNLFNSITSLRSYSKPLSDGQLNFLTIDAFIDNATSFYKCRILTDLCEQYLATSVQGVAPFSTRVFKMLIAIHYLGFYFYEATLAVDEDELQYIRDKYRWNIISNCIEHLGISITDAETIFNNSIATNNTPPIVSNVDITISPNDLGGGIIVWEHTFSVSDFTSNYQDAQGDNPAIVTIQTLPYLGTLYFNGVPIVLDFTFDYNQAGLLTYRTDNNITVDEEDYFFFRISDDNQNSLQSDLTRITFDLQANLNLPPSCVDTVELMVEFGVNFVLPAAPFIAAFTDPEGDNIGQLRITYTNLPQLVRFYNNGIEVLSGGTIPFSDVIAGNVEVIPEPGVGGPVLYEVTYEASDEGSGIFVGSC